MGHVGQEKQQLVLEGKVHEQDYKFLVDTGATHNFIPEQFVNDNGLAIELGKKVKVNLANGDYVMTNRFARCMVDFGTLSGFLYFTVLPNCPLILGMSFLRAYNPVIDFENMSIMLEKRGTSCPPV